MSLRDITHRLENLAEITLPVNPEHFYGCEYVRNQPLDSPFTAQEGHIRAGRKMDCSTLQRSLKDKTLLFSVIMLLSYMSGSSRIDIKKIGVNGKLHQPDRVSLDIRSSQ